VRLAEFYDIRKSNLNVGLPSNIKNTKVSQ